MKAELDEAQVDEAKNLVTSSDFHNDITSAIQSVAPGATADPISPDSISIEEVQDEESKNFTQYSPSLEINLDKNNLKTKNAQTEKTYDVFLIYS